MKLEDLPVDFTPDQFKQLDKESLDRIPYERKRWLCQCKGCKNGTHIRDYGLGELFFLDRNSKNATRNPGNYWMGPRNYWLCGKHNKLFKRLENQYAFEHIWRRLIDQSKDPIQIIDRSTINTITKIEGHERKNVGHCPGFKNIG